MHSYRIDCVVGARPNFVKIAPIMRALGDRDGMAPRLIHTGQHYDPNMSDVFFQDLGMGAPDLYLDVGSGSHGVQTAKVMGLQTVAKRVMGGDHSNWLTALGVDFVQSFEVSPPVGLETLLSS